MTSFLTDNGATILKTILATFNNHKSSALGLYILYVIFKYRNTALGVKPRSDIGGPKGLPLIGNTYDIIKRPLDKNFEIQTQLHEEYGRAYAMTILGVGRLIQVSDPAVVDHFLRVNFWAYEKGDDFYKILFPLTGNGIFSADGQHWKWQRKLASRIFTVQGFREFTDTVFVKEADLARDYLSKNATSASSIGFSEGKVVDLSEIFYKFTLDSFGEIAFGQTFGCLADPEKEVEFASAFDRLNTILSHRFATPFWQIVHRLTGEHQRMVKDTKIIYDFAYDVIRKRRLQGFNKKHKDLLQLFLEAHDEDDQPLSDEMLKDTLMNFVIAGRDTTAQALSWMFYLIHRSSARKDILEKLREETDRLLQGGHPTYETIKQQKYAEACFHETLRLYPSVPQNVKVCVQDDILPGGIKVYKDEKVAWSTWAMGRDKGIWGPDAHEFRPERWLEGEKPSSSKFVSFHLGPRTCLGQQFATIEAITILSMLIQRFEFELVDPAPAYTFSLTLPMAKGLPMRVKHRASMDSKHACAGAKEE
ncbi:hypothetical protein BGZ94_008667 [Podila epigama]|nr:hypothetical protein BGZ94_008667 [Podila epigama]